MERSKGKSVIAAALAMAASMGVGIDMTGRAYKRNVRAKVPALAFYPRLGRSKYKPHQGKQEIERRWNRLQVQIYTDIVKEF